MPLIELLTRAMLSRFGLALAFLTVALVLALADQSGSQLPKQIDLPSVKTVGTAGN